MSFIDFACSNLFVSFIIASGLYAFIKYENNDVMNDDMNEFSIVFMVVIVPIICLLSLIPALHLLMIIPVAFNFYGGIILTIILIQKLMLALHDACSHKHVVNERYAYAMKNDACNDDDMHVNNAIDYKEDATDYSERIIS